MDRKKISEFLRSVAEMALRADEAVLRGGLIDEIAEIIDDIESDLKVVNIELDSAREDEAA